MSDGNIFANSILGRKLSASNLDLPTSENLPGQNIPTPFVFVGDEAFPLMPNLMRPYPKRQTSDNVQHKIFNYRLSRARQTVECAFGIMAAKFRVFKRPFECKLETVDDVVKATCVLHNYLRTGKINRHQAADGVDDGDLMEGLGASEHQLLPLMANRVRNSNEAFQVRERFTKFFNSAAGSVPWQQRSVQRGHY